MYRVAVYLAIITLSFSLISCATSSTSQKTDTEKQAPEAEKYPDWYAADHPVVSTDSLFYGYGTALGSDSASTVDQAAAEAKRELKISISEQIENIRTEAAEELSSDSGIDSPQFILSLRKAENVILYIASQTQSRVEPVEEYSGYRAFSELQIHKDELLERLAGELSEYETAWKALRDSQAFDDF